MYSRQGRWVLVGMTSFGIGSRCDNEYYSMFTDVGLFYDWIEERVKTAEEEIDFSTIQKWQQMDVVTVKLLTDIEVKDWGFYSRETISYGHLVEHM